MKRAMLQLLSDPSPPFSFPEVPLPLLPPLEAEEEPFVPPLFFPEEALLFLLALLLFPESLLFLAPVLLPLLFLEVEDAEELLFLLVELLLLSLEEAALFLVPLL